MTLQDSGYWKISHTAPYPKGFFPVRILLSKDQKWIASSGRDGLVLVHRVVGSKLLLGARLPGFVRQEGHALCFDP